MFLNYVRTSLLEGVNESRPYLFTKKNRLDPLIQHLKRATYQGKLACQIT